MVHVSADGGGRHKMLAFSTSAEPTFTGIDSLIKVNTKEVVTFNDSSSPNSATGNHRNSNSTVPTLPPPTSDFHSAGIIGLNHQSATSSPIVPKTILKNTLNSFDKSASSPKYRLSDKMFAEEDSAALVVNNNGNNGNANYLADTINSNSNNRMANSSPNNRGDGSNMAYDQHELDLISHGLTDSVCETIKLLESDYDKKCSTTTASLSSGISASSSSTSGGLGGGIDDVGNNVVYTEEIVISTARSNSSAVTGMTKPGIMKTFSSFSSASNAGGGGGHHQVIHRNRVISSTEQWKNQLNEEAEDEEAMSNESEETPLLTAEQSSSMATHGSDNISNDSLPGSGAGLGANAPSSALHKMGKMTNGTKATGLKRVSFGSSKGSMVETLIYESPVSDEHGKSGKGGTLPILTNGACRSSSKGEVAHDSPDSTASGMADNEPNPSQPEKNVQPLQQKVLLPVAAVEDLEKLNAYLTTDNGILSLKRHFAGTGGSTLEESVQRTMEKLLPDELMVMFSLKGKRGKRSFQAEFKFIYDGITECVREYPSLSLIVKAGRADDKTIEQAMASSFKKACDRVARRKLGSTGGSRPPSRVRVTFFESEKPLAVSSPESDILDFDLSKMTIHGSPTVHDPSSPSYNRQISVEGWDNPFRPDGDLSKEADQIVELIKEGKPINDETLRSKSPSVNEPMNTSSSIPTQNQLNASPKGKEVNGSATNGTNGPVDIQHIVVAPAAQAGQVEHVVLKKKKGCCVIQ